MTTAAGEQGQTIEQEGGEKPSGLILPASRPDRGVPAASRAAPPATTSPDDLIARAIDRGIDGDALEKLMALKERHEAAEARKAWVAAMAQFKADPPTIEKNRHVHYSSKDDRKPPTDYWHADLAQVTRKVGAAMAPLGLSFRWATNQDGDRITVSCLIEHELGHVEQTTLSGPADSSGGKNSIQAVGSAVTYLQRYTLLAATGLATRDQDDDGRGSEAPEVELLDESQVAELEAMLHRLEMDPAPMLTLVARKWKLDPEPEKVADLPAESYTACKNWLGDRVAAMGSGSDGD